MSFSFVDFNEKKWRLFFSALHEKVVEFLIETDNPPEMCTVWLTRLLNNDPNIFIVVEFGEDFTIESHAVITLEQDNKGKFFFCHQLKAKAKKNSSFVSDVITYFDELKSIIPDLYEMRMLTNESKAKAFQKKYGFSVERVLMTRKIEKSLTRVDDPSLAS